MPLGNTWSQFWLAVNCSYLYRANVNAMALNAYSFTSDKQISPPSIIGVETFAFTLFVHGYSFQINYLGNSFWLGGEICSSDINMHKDYSWEILRTVHFY